MKQVPIEEDRFYHIFNRGNNRENIFKEEKNYGFFLKKLKQHILPIANIYAYCLLPNHFHIVLQIKESKALPEDYRLKKKGLHQPFSKLFNSYTKAINRGYNRTGSLFQEHLHRNLIDTEEYLKDVIIYTILNPVQHGLSLNYKSYRYSSFIAIISKQKTDLMRDEVLELFESAENFIYSLNNRNIRNTEQLREIDDCDG